MIAVAQIIREHRGVAARTLRAFGVGISDLGDRLLWGEAKLLLEGAAVDPSTPLGAELAGWAYPASTLELLSLMAQIGDQKAAKKLMPWALPKNEPTADAAEVAEAQAALDEGLVFSS
ncbi:hypothetical protein [Microbacterium sp. AR7-10]|uniref:hypothetical protein n=1 Tax=Microbacterium sp. AR7-10 TaxID=1891970 RepID=UPI0008FCD00F|nr:hypothetical protein [Microbacterium sp. AR7-10]OIU88662.1 hypothetical protein BFN01_04255 [Microbacterium sp. AR7-10]